MDINAGRPGADNNNEEFVPCGLDCSCSEEEFFAEDVSRVLEIVQNAEECGCSDCEELLFVAEISGLVAFELASKLNRGVVDYATSEAVKSTLDTVALSPAFEEDTTAYDFNFDSPPVFADDGCGDPSCFICYYPEMEDEGGALDLVADLSKVVELTIASCEALVESLKRKFKEIEGDAQADLLYVEALDERVKALEAYTGILESSHGF